MHVGNSHISMNIPETVRQDEEYLSFWTEKGKQGCRASKRSKAIYQGLKRVNFIKQMQMFAGPSQNCGMQGGL